MRVWDLSIKAHGSNFILLTRREALRHTEIGGKSGYPELFRRHVDDILSDILLSVPYDAEETLHDESDSEPSSFMDEDEDFLDYFELNIESLSVPPPKTPLDRGLPPLLDENKTQEDWAREIQLWWCLRFHSSPPLVVLKTIVAAIEGK